MFDLCALKKAMGFFISWLWLVTCTSQHQANINSYFSTGSLRECQGSGVVALHFAKWRTGNVRQGKKEAMTVMGRKKREREEQTEREVGYETSRLSNTVYLSTSTPLQLCVCVSSKPAVTVIYIFFNGMTMDSLKWLNTTVSPNCFPVRFLKSYLYFHVLPCTWFSVFCPCILSVLFPGFFC